MGCGPLVHYYPRCVNSEYGDSLCTCVYVFRLLVIEYIILCGRAFERLWYATTTKQKAYCIIAFLLSLKMPHGIFLVLYGQYRLPHPYK